MTIHLCNNENGKYSVRINGSPIKFFPTKRQAELYISTTRTQVSRAFGRRDRESERLSNLLSVIDSGDALKAGLDAANIATHAFFAHPELRQGA